MDRLKKLQRVAGTMVIREITLGRKHNCPNCKSEIPKGEEGLAWYSTRTKSNQAIYCSKDCMNEAELKRHGFLEM